jgi:1-acyl-sn-glycerol-3-phosphate acyltransferase
MWLFMVSASPLLLALAFAWDMARPAPRLFAALRTVLFFMLFLTCDVYGLGGALATWLGNLVWPGKSRERLLRWNALLQRVWGRAIISGAVRIYSMRMEVEGLECTAPGPYLLFVRHVSTADTLLGVALVSYTRHIVLRHVIKKELLWDPCLEIVGNRLPNVFVDRSSASPEREIAAVRNLAHNLGERDGVIIFPEGTRFTPDKLKRVRARLEASAAPEIMARVDRMKHVLPPRRGGPVALLEVTPPLDVVFLAHTGFEGVTRLADLFNGAMVNRVVRVNFSRVAAADRAGKDPLAWLYDQWLEIDRWVGEAQSAGEGSGGDRDTAARQSRPDNHGDQRAV